MSFICKRELEEKDKDWNLGQASVSHAKQTQSLVLFILGDYRYKISTYPVCRCGGHRLSLAVAQIFGFSFPSLYCMWVVVLAALFGHSSGNIKSSQGFTLPLHKTAAVFSKDWTKTSGFNPAVLCPDFGALQREAAELGVVFQGRAQEGGSQCFPVAATLSSEPQRPRSCLGFVCLKAGANLINECVKCWTFALGLLKPYGHGPTEGVSLIAMQKYALHLNWHWKLTGAWY